MYEPQAEGLTVKTGKARYTPLFLSKADLDVALANADGQRCAAVHLALFLNTQRQHFCADVLNLVCSG
jgi:hypothetical protein